MQASARISMLQIPSLPQALQTNILHSPLYSGQNDLPRPPDIPATAPRGSTKPKSANRQVFSIPRSVISRAAWRKRSDSEAKAEEFRADTLLPRATKVNTFCFLFFFPISRRSLATSSWSEPEVSSHDHNIISLNFSVYQLH